MWWNKNGAHKKVYVTEGIGYGTSLEVWVIDAERGGRIGVVDVVGYGDGGKWAGEMTLRGSGKRMLFTKNSVRAVMEHLLEQAGWEMVG